MKKQNSKQSRLIGDILKAHGGLIKASQKLRISKQLLSYWKQNGCVPMSRVVEVALILKVPPIALNYKELNKILGGNNEWDTVKKDTYLALRLL